MPGSLPEFEELYQQYAEDLFRFSLRLCQGRRDDAEDVVQEAFLRIWQHRESFAGRSSLRHWLYRITYNAWLRRCEKERPTMVLDEEIAATVAAPDLAPQRLEVLAVQEALSQLSELQRRAVLAVKCQGLSYEEAALVLDAPVGTVKTRVHDGLKALRRILVTIPSGAAALVTAAFLDSCLHDAWAEPLPARLRLRVREAVERAPASMPLFPEDAPPPLSPARFPPAGVLPGPASRPLRVAAAAAGAVLVGAGLWFLRPRPPVPRSPVAAAYLKRLEGVRSLHATGTYLQTEVGPAAVRSTPSRLEYWYEAPDRFRRERKDRGAGVLANVVIVNGSEAVITPVLPGRALQPQVIGTEQRDSELALLAPLIHGSQAAELLSSNDLQVQSGTLSGLPVTYLRITRTASRGRAVRWTLTLPREGGLPIRLDRIAGRIERGRWTPTVVTTLERLEWNRDLPEALFRLPALSSSR